jgi:hypothetical protein
MQQDIVLSQIEQETGYPTYTAFKNNIVKDSQTLQPVILVIGLTTKYLVRVGKDIKSIYLHIGKEELEEKVEAESGQLGVD